jgi:lantibiotic leader peptide-processing serine protease
MRHGLFRRLALLGLLVLAGAAFASAANAGNYLVLYKQQSVASGAGATIRNAGGSVVASYPEIGVVIAQSDSVSFRSNLLKDARIWGAASTAGMGVQVDNAGLEASGPPIGDLPNFPANDSAEPLFPLQWDMRQIHTPEAHAITGGSPEVLVGDIDTGLDFTHPDLAPNYDAANSTDCSSGAPAPLLPGNDVFGHGTHTAGTIAAAQNGIGIVGVAPRVKIAGIKSSNNAGFFFPEMVVCSFMWAGTHGIDVTNNSYFADPFLYNCRNDPVQRAIWKAEKRAIDFATKQGVTHFASLGNDSDDRAHPTIDVISPDFPPGTEEEREITNACVVIPVEVNGVVGVSAVGSTRQTDEDDDPNDYLKSFYSAYGVGVTEVTAPGGDSIFFTPESVNGRVLSTWPAELPCLRRRDEPGIPAAAYCYLQGTSMAAPHAAGVAALTISCFGDLDNPQNGKMRPGSVAAYVQQTADAQPCPTALPPGYAAFTRPDDQPQECQGGPGKTSWYGAGQVNALRAVTHDTGN